MSLLLNKLEYLLPKDALWDAWVEIGQVVLEKKMKMLKVYRQTDGQTDGPTNGHTTDARQSEMLT